MDTARHPAQPRVSRLTVTDQTYEREDLARRSEVKYALNAADIGKLRSHLAGNCRRLIHNEPVSVVRSIYFDDERLSACRANLDGVGSRRKLRLRWYDSLQPQHDFYLEIKWRENKVTGKHRLHINSPDPLESLSYPDILRQLEDAVPEAFRCAMLKAPEPTVIVEYRREHFSSPDGSLRLTLDYDLTYYDQTGRRNVCTDFPCRLGDLVVVEGKVPVGHEADLRRQLHPYIPRANRCSKYVHGCRLLGLIRGGE